MEPRYNEPLCNEVLGITNDFLHTLIVKYTKKKQQQQKKWMYRSLGVANKLCQSLGPSIFYRRPSRKITYVYDDLIIRILILSSTRTEWMPNLCTGSRGDVFVVRTSKAVENRWKNGLFWSPYSFVTHSIDRKPRDRGLARSAYSIKYGKGGNKFGADFRIPETQMELNEIAWFF